LQDIRPHRTNVLHYAAIVPAYQLTEPAVAAFVIIPLLLLAVLVWGIVAVSRRAGDSPEAARRTGVIAAVVAIAWMAMTWIAGAAGVLRAWDRRPPPFAFLIVGIVVVSCTLAFSRAGRHLATLAPLWALVAVQSFRLPLELAMHSMYERGIMPVEMTYTGRNFDIVTGATALIVAALVFVGVGGRRLVAAWNVLGFALLLNVVIVAILATPVFSYFGSEHLNTFVTYVPFVWLPAVMVSAALAGHLIIARALVR
jgi:hypothetical protein